MSTKFAQLELMDSVNFYKLEYEAPGLRIYCGSLPIKNH